MRKKSIVASFILSGILLIPSNMYARDASYLNDGEQSHEFSSEELVECLFDGYDDNKNVIRLEDGSYLQGQCTVVDTYDQSIVYAYYDSETDDNAMSVEEAKEELIAIENGEIEIPIIQSRGSDVPSQTRVMSPGTSYTSNKFTSQSGWRFGGYLFQCASGSVGTQVWTTYVDSGKVGTLGDAINQRNNPNLSFGFSIYPGSSMSLGTRYNWGYASYCYYTYAPYANTYYKVTFS